MNLQNTWQSRVDALWDRFDDYLPADFIAAMRALTDELPGEAPDAQFELGGAYDSTGFPNEAIALYRQALASGLAGSSRRQATIQLASSLRNIGQAKESIALLEAELTQPSDELDGAVRGFLALALVAGGRDREGVGHSLAALSKYLPRYSRSLAAYAEEYIGAKTAADD